jgi:SNF2 family DNA or RNA helicase
LLTNFFSNLTNANHVIFLAPFWNQFQPKYDEFYTQSIGRVRRYGQKKTVHVYHLVALHTVDVCLVEDFSKGKKLVQREGSGVFELEHVDNLTDEERAQDWGTVRLRAHKSIRDSIGKWSNVE